MNLIKAATARKRAQTNTRRAIEQADRDRLTEREREHKKWFNGIAKKILPSIRSLNGKRGFVLKKPESLLSGELISVWRKDELVGTVCIDKHAYQWSGSDESPEQTCHEDRIWFTRAPYLKEHQSTVNHFHAETPKEFLASFVSFLAGYDS